MSSVEASLEAVDDGGDFQPVLLSAEDRILQRIFEVIVVTILVFSLLGISANLVNLVVFVRQRRVEGVNSSLMFLTLSDLCAMVPLLMYSLVRLEYTPRDSAYFKAFLVGCELMVFVIIL